MPCNRERGSEELINKRNHMFILSFFIIASLFFSGCSAQKNGAVNITEEELDKLVGEAVKSRGSLYAEGEVVTEGHVVLEAAEANGSLKIYTVASLGIFGFENGIFTIVSGSGSIPTVLVFSKDKEGGYSLQEYQEPLDGSGYAESIKKMFPGELYEKVVTTSSYDELLNDQKKEQAAEYLEDIGRTAEISTSHVPKKLLDIDVGASNKIIGEMSKYNQLINDCPYWMGTREKIEDGTRYVYQTSQSSTQDGFDLVIFTKTREDGTLVMEEKYKIVGSELILLND